MPYGDIGVNMNKARVAEAVRGTIKLKIVDLRLRSEGALAEEPKVSVWDNLKSSDIIYICLKYFSLKTTLFYPLC